MNPTLSFRSIARPWILGSYAVYAHDLHVARRAVEVARSLSDPGPFGTVELDTGEKVDWINMNYGVACPGRDG